MREQLHVAAIVALAQVEPAAGRRNRGETLPQRGERQLDPSPGLGLLRRSQRNYQAQPAIAVAIRDALRQRHAFGALCGHQLGRLRVAEFAVIGLEHFIEVAAVQLQLLRLRQLLAQRRGRPCRVTHQGRRVHACQHFFDRTALGGDFPGQRLDGLVLGHMHALDRIAFVGNQPGLPCAEQPQQQQHGTAGQRQQGLPVDPQVSQPFFRDVQRHTRPRGCSRGPARSARASPADYWMPVEPNPPPPRSLGAKSATMFNRACATGTSSSWAMRSPTAMVYDWLPRFQHEIISGPW